jgi:hypothetical protein
MLYQCGLDDLKHVMKCLYPLCKKEILSVFSSYWELDFEIEIGDFQDCKYTVSEI